MTSEFSDPRTDIDHPINIGQIYEDSRSGDLTKIIYLDNDVGLLRDEDGNHRIERRTNLDRLVGAGRLSLEPEAEFGYAGRMEALTAALERYEDEGGRKDSHKAEALREALSLLTEETAQFEEVPFEELDGVGSTTASRLRAAEYATIEDVRRATDEELLEISGVGEANLQSIRDYVN